jgi:hypothetical protein
VPFYVFIYEYFYGTPKLLRTVHFEPSNGSYVLVLHEQPTEYDSKSQRKLVEYLDPRGTTVIPPDALILSAPSRGTTVFLS